MHILTSHTNSADLAQTQYFLCNLCSRGYPRRQQKAAFTNKASTEQFLQATSFSPRLVLTNFSIFENTMNTSSVSHLSTGTRHAGTSTTTTLQVNVNTPRSRPGTGNQHWGGD